MVVGLEMIIAIDVDNTLIHEVDGSVCLNTDVVALMVAIHNLGVADIVVWSGGGQDYARHVVEKYGLTHLVYSCDAKGSVGADITLDDQDMSLGLVNLKLPGDIEATPWMGV
jgi:hypothetical protein